MAEIRDEKGKAGEVPNDSARCCGGNSEPVPQALNSLRGAAIALCMSVEELKELLGGKDVTTKYSKELADDKVKQLRAEVAFLKSENHRLQQEITSQEIELRRYKNSFIIRF